MFDDQTNPAPDAGSPPANLPIGEPEDMFADAESSAVPPSPPSGAPQATVRSIEAPSAVDAGRLKPKLPESAQPALQPMPAAVPPLVHTPPPEMTQSMDDIKEPRTAKRIMMVTLILVGVAVLVGIIWFVFGWLTRSKSLDLAPGDRQSGAATGELTPPTAASAPPPVGVLPDVINERGADSIDDTVLFGEPIDVDGDNLDQAREQTIGTDPDNWDTDGDELSDGDEVIIWKTDPNNPDTDGDTYTDGSEVKNGYSPTGPGKLFQPPASGT